MFFYNRRDQRTLHLKKPAGTGIEPLPAGFFRSMEDQMETMERSVLSGLRLNVLGTVPSFKSSPRGITGVVNHAGEAHFLSNRDAAIVCSPCAVGNGRFRSVIFLPLRDLVIGNDGCPGSFAFRAVLQFDFHLAQMVLHHCGLHRHRVKSAAITKVGRIFARMLRVSVHFCDKSENKKERKAGDQEFFHRNPPFCRIFSINTIFILNSIF